MYSDYAALKKDLESSRVSTADIVKYYLSKISEGKHLNAFLSVYTDDALEKAAALDRKLKSGTSGRLAGMVIAVKDVLAIKDKTLTCGSNSSLPSNT